MLNFSVLLTHYFAGDKIEKNEIGGACSSDGEGEKQVQGFGGKPEVKSHWGDPGVDGGNTCIKMDLQEV
jgi:hypothetical protein